MKYLLFIIFIIYGNQKEKYDLSLNLEVGQTYNQTIRTESDFLMMVNDEEILIGTIFEARFSYKVIEIHDTFCNLQVQYEKLSIVNKSPMGKSEFSSDTEDSTNIMSGFMREMVHKPFTASLNKNGKITEVLNIDTLYSTVWNGKAGEMISSNGKITEKLNEQMGAGVIMENFELLSAFYPDGQVVIGEPWSNLTILGNRLAGTTMNKFSLIDVVDGDIFIEGASETYTKDNDASMEIMGKKYQYDLDGGIIFNCKMDYRTGWIEEATIKQDFKGEIKMLAEEAWNNRIIPVAISSVTIITK